MNHPLFSAREIRTAVIGPWDVALPVGTITALHGPSGSGKSLLLRSLADLDPHTGTLSVAGTDSLDIDGPAWRNRVGMLPSESAWWTDSVGDHFPDGDPSIVTRLGFDADVFTWTIDRLSSGERQRLGLARLLAYQPQILLLDEPTANLDEENTTLIEGLVGNYVREDERAALWVSHDRDQWKRLGNREYAIVDGELREVGE
jgi:ABC-type iron transport system FetAB ATPase subunit